MNDVPNSRSSPLSRDPTVQPPLADHVHVVHRALTSVKEAEQSNRSLTTSYLIFLVSLLAMVGIYWIDVANFEFGLGQFLPDVNGGADMAPVRYAETFALASGTVLSGVALRQATQRLGGWLNKTLDWLGLGGVIVLVASVVVFLPASISLATGGDDASVSAATEHSGSSLGLALGSLYLLSVAANRLMLDWLLESLANIAAVRALRAKVASVRTHVARIEAGVAEVHEADRKIDEMGKPGALAMQASVDMANEIGGVTSVLHAKMLERELIEGIGGDPSVSDYTPEQLDEQPIDPTRYMRVERLQQLGRYLAKFTPAYIFNLLREVEA